MCMFGFVGFYRASSIATDTWIAANTQIVTNTWIVDYSLTLGVGFFQEQMGNVCYLL